MSVIEQPLGDQNFDGDYEVDEVDPLCVVRQRRGWPRGLTAYWLVECRSRILHLVSPNMLNAISSIRWAA